MEALSNISTRDVLSVIGLTLVIVVALLRIRQLHKNEFSYYTATLFSTETNFGGTLKTYDVPTRGQVLRKCQKTGVWELSPYQHFWIPLNKDQVELVEKSLVEGREIKLILD